MKKIEDLHPVDQKILSRLFKRTQVTEDGHWLWQGSLSGKYGNIKIGIKTLKVHRLSCYLFLDLNINDESQLACHKNSCHIPNCWNPEHLYVGNRESNIQDAIELSIHLKRTHYKNGHELTQENIYFKILNSGRTSRECRFCRKQASVKYRKNNGRA